MKFEDIKFIPFVLYLFLTLGLSGCIVTTSVYDPNQYYYTERSATGLYWYNGHRYTYRHRHKNYDYNTRRDYKNYDYNTRRNDRYDRNRRNDRYDRNRRNDRKHGPKVLRQDRYK